MIPVLDPFMADARPTGLQRGRGGFLRSADDAPYVTDPSGEVCKTGDRKGEVKRVKYGSPSNRGREIENDAALVKYRQRLSFLGVGMDNALVEQCRDLVLMDADSDEFKHAADKIAVEADKLTRSWLAADRGTHGHLLCELFDLKGNWWVDDTIADGQALGLSPTTQDDVVAAWRGMLADNGLEILAIEASCVDDRWRLAGTLDRIVRTTKPLTFAKSTGELVTIPANTVMILDIKFGKCRKAHPIQIASYAQSVPYDTETEQRGVWPWPIDQTHALIAHGDFGDDFRPPSIELVWVDLVAGREHGGQCVVDAKAWAARDDVFSVAQIVEGQRVADHGNGPSTPSSEDSCSSSTSQDDCDPHGIPRPVPPVPAAGEVEAASACDVPPSPALLDPTVNDLLPRQGMPQHALDELEVDRLNDARRQSYDGWCSKYIRARIVSEEVEALPGCRWGKPDDAKALPTDISQGCEMTPEVGLKNEAPARAYSTTSPDPARLALVDARAALCPNPDEGADWSSDEFAPLWDELRGLFDDLDPVARAWRSELANQAKRRHVDFLAQGGRTERRYWINKAVICLALADEAQTEPVMRELLAHIIGDVALMLGVEPGHALGSLNAVEAARFAGHVDAYLSPLTPVA